jgi:hypothetical protein
MNLQRLRKAVALVLVGIGTFVASILTDGISPEEWAMIAAVGLSSAGVYVVPELPLGVAAVAKTVLTFLVTGSTTLALVVGGGLTGAELLEVVLAACAAIGLVAVVPNVGDHKAQAGSYLRAE